MGFAIRPTLKGQERTCPRGIVAKEGNILCKPLPTRNNFSQSLPLMVCRFWSEPLHFVVLFIAHINMM